MEKTLGGRIAELLTQLTASAGEVKAKLEQIQSDIASLNEKIENGKNTIMWELSKRATIKSKMGRLNEVYTFHSKAFANGNRKGIH